MSFKPAHRAGIPRHTRSRLPAFAIAWNFEHNPDMMVILIEWSPHPDLDIAVGFAWGKGVGWSVGDRGPFGHHLIWESSDNTSGGPERVLVDITSSIAGKAADPDGKVRVYICAGWYTADATGGLAAITATFKGKQARRTTSNLPNNNGGQATHRVAIAVWDPAEQTLSLESP